MGGSAPDAASPYGSTAVYLYRHVGTKWEPDGVLPSSNPNESFGQSISVDGSFVAVGAPSAANGYGVVYVYVTESGATRLEQRIDYPHPSAVFQAGFGYSVALRGTSLIVGAQTDSISGDASGRVYVYERSGGTWTLTSELVSNDIQPNDAFGALVAFDGTRIAALAPTFGSEAARLYVFARSSSGWVEEARLVPPANTSPVFSNVAIDGDATMVSTYDARVLVYGRGSGTWMFEGELPPANYGYSASIDLRGPVAAVGRLEGVEIFDRVGGAWKLRETLHAGDEPTSRSYGVAVALGADSVAVLAYFDDDWGAGSGAVYGYLADPTTKYDPQCVQESTTPGDGTLCTRSGATGALCRNLGSGAGRLYGSTPDGNIDLPHVWLDTTRGLSEELRFVFGESTPRREDAVPRLSFRVSATSVAGQALPFDVTVDNVSLALCDGAHPVPPATVTFTSFDDVLWLPLAGTVSIQAPGWNLTGGFTLDGACQTSSSH